MLRIDRIHNAELGELAEILDRAACAPWCGNLKGCLEDLEHDREIPEERCRACIIGWLLGEEDSHDTCTDPGVGQGVSDAGGHCSRAGE